MSSVGSRRWSLDLAFIRKGRAQIVSPFTRRKESISWSSKTYPAKLLPISFVECRMSGMGCEAFGYGDSTFFKNSLTQAFAESWERLWLKVLRSLPAGQHPDAKNSNGFACGPTAEEAESAARGELIERAILLKAWSTRSGWEIVTQQGVVNGMLFASLSSQGWRLRFFKITESEWGNVLCCLGTKDSGGILFDSCYCGPGVRLRDAQAKVLRSLLRTSLASEGSTRALKELPKKGRPEDHAAFYRNAEHLKAFEFLSRNGRPSQIELGHYGETRSEVLVDIEDFPVLAAARNPKWPRMSWGLESIAEGGNPWPHPLA